MSHTHTISPSVMDAYRTTNGNTIHRCHQKVTEEEHQCFPHVVSHSLTLFYTVFYTEGTSVDGSPPGSPVHGILQPRTPEWVAISFSNA